MLIWDGRDKPGSYGCIDHVFKEKEDGGVRAETGVSQSYDQKQCLSLAAFLIMVVAKQRGVPVEEVVIHVKRS